MESRAAGQMSEIQQAGNSISANGRVPTMFRFQDMDIWKRAIAIGDRLLDVADDLEHRKLFRFAEQLRGASLSISNNIAEGSGSGSKRDFAQFLNIAKRSAFEDANMLIVFNRRKLISAETCAELLKSLEEECRMLTSFMRSLR
jgi:four helix bundle protein